MRDRVLCTVRWNIEYESLAVGLVDGSMLELNILHFAIKELRE